MQLSVAKSFKGDKDAAVKQAQQSQSTILKPIREELDFGPDIYESLDEAMIDITQERLEDARRPNTPFDHFELI